MSTNYNLYYKICPHCGQHKTLHIGQFAAGWKFLFQGSIFKTKKEWFTALQDEDSKIFDEYGTEVSFDTLRKWIEGAQDRGARCNTMGAGEDWIDDEGFEFTSMDFS